MPLGLTKNRLAFPNTPNVPKISEGLPPVTRVRIFSIAAGLSKNASRPTSILNSPKLWNKLLPRIAPPSMRSTNPSNGVTIELSLPNVSSGMSCAIAGFSPIPLPTAIANAGTHHPKSAIDFPFTPKYVTISPKLSVF